MSAARKLKINIGGVAVLATQKSISINNEPIDTTDDGDSGHQTYDDDYGLRSMEISIEGVVKTAQLRALSLATSQKIANMTIEFPPIGVLASDTIDSDFVMTAYTEGGAVGESNKFTATFASSGVITRTPGT